MPDSLAYLTFLASELGDIYSKSKALDLVASEKALDRLDREAAREDVQAFQEEQAIVQRDWQAEEAKKAEERAILARQLDRTSREQLSALGLLNQDLQVARKQQLELEEDMSSIYGVSPIYSTDASKEIKLDMSKGIEGQIEYINARSQQIAVGLRDLKRQKRGLLEEEQWYRDVSADYGGDNLIIQSGPEYDAMMEAALEAFPGKRLAGVKKAYGEEFKSAAEKQRTIIQATAALSTAPHERAEGAFTYLSALATDPKREGAFWKASSDTHKPGDAKYWNMATVEGMGKQAFQMQDYQSFLNSVYLKPKLYKQLQNNPSTSNLLYTMEQEAAKVRALEDEQAGIFPAQPETGIRDHHMTDFKTKLDSLNVLNTPLKQQFDWFMNLTNQAGAMRSPADAQKKFGLLEEAHGGKDLGPEFQKYLDDPEGYGKADDKVDTGIDNASIESMLKAKEAKEAHRIGMAEWQQEAYDIWGTFARSGTGPFADYMTREVFPEINNAGDIPTAIAEGKVRPGWERGTYMPEGKAQEIDERVYEAAMEIAERDLGGVATVGRIFTDPRSFWEAGRGDVKEFLTNYYNWKKKIGSPFESPDLKKLYREAGLNPDGIVPKNDTPTSTSSIYSTQTSNAWNLENLARGLSGAASQTKAVDYGDSFDEAMFGDVFNYTAEELEEHILNDGAPFPDTEAFGEDYNLTPKQLDQMFHPTFLDIDASKPLKRVYDSDRDIPYDPETARIYRHPARFRDARAIDSVWSLLNQPPNERHPYWSDEARDLVHEVKVDSWLYNEDIFGQPLDWPRNPFERDF